MISSNRVIALWRVMSRSFSKKVENRHASHHELANFQRHGERLVEFDQSSRCECPDEVRERAFRKTDQGIAVYTAVVPQAFVRTDRHFGR